jgi:hypothetical protein
VSYLKQSSRNGIIRLCLVCATAVLAVNLAAQANQLVNVIPPDGCDSSDDSVGNDLSCSIGGACSPFSTLSSVGSSAYADWYCGPLDAFQVDVQAEQISSSAVGAGGAAISDQSTDVVCAWAAYQDCDGSDSGPDSCSWDCTS